VCSDRGEVISPVAEKVPDVDWVRVPSRKVPAKEGAIVKTAIKAATVATEAME
jgi:hypothetical protein